MQVRELGPQPFTLPGAARPNGATAWTSTLSSDWGAYLEVLTVEHIFDPPALKVFC
jgi:hypothetical protein